MRFVYLMSLALCFAGGAYYWHIKNAMVRTHNVVDGSLPIVSPSTLNPELVGTTADAAVVIQIGEEKLTRGDVDWEYALATEAAFDRSHLTPIPDLGSRYHTELKDLRKTLIATLIERKVLFQYIRQDKNFSMEEPSRYSACLIEWQNALKQDNKIFESRENRQRLKTRICERSLLEQYASERLYGDLKISEAEIVEYFKNHLPDFKQGERVTIRQIVLPDEATARRIQHQVHANNFVQMAKQHSISPEGKAGGKLGPFAKGSMPSFFDAAFDMKPGDISDIQRSPYGYHIMTVLEKKPKSEETLEEAHPKIEKILKDKKRSQIYGSWVETALAAVKVTTPQPLW